MIALGLLGCLAICAVAGAALGEFVAWIDWSICDRRYRRGRVL